MANFKVTPYAGAVVENTKLDFQSLYLRRIISGPNKNETTVIDGYGTTDFGLTTINNWGVYDGMGTDAKLVARTKGLRMNAAENSWCSLFVIVFELERFKGSTLEVVGATIEEQEGEWAIVGGTGDFAMARGVIQRKMHQKTADGEVLELTMDAFCRMKMQQLPRPSPKKYGPWGGQGRTLHDITPYVPSRLVSVSFMYYAAVNGFSFTYVDQDGQERDSGLFGNNDHANGRPKQTVKLDPTEFVTELSGTFSKNRTESSIAIWSLKLVTNLKEHGPFGTEGAPSWNPTKGTPFRFVAPPNNRIVGFYGSSEPYSLSSIGVYTVENSV